MDFHADRLAASAYQQVVDPLAREFHLPNLADRRRTVRGGMERRMIARRICVLGAVLLMLAACAKPEHPGYQGWVEADLIFVSPDEYGRVEILSVREGIRQSSV